VRALRGGVRGAEGRLKEMLTRYEDGLPDALPKITCLIARCISLGLLLCEPDDEILPFRIQGPAGVFKFFYTFPKRRIFVAQFHNDRGHPAGFLPQLLEDQLERTASLGPFFYRIQVRL